MEGVLKRATKIITCLKGMEYADRLATLELTTLAKRRERGDLIEQYKILHGLEELDWFVSQQLPARAVDCGFRALEHRHDQRLRPQEKVACKERRQFFTNRVVGPWNSLPGEAVESLALGGFKEWLIELGYSVRRTDTHKHS